MKIIKLSLVMYNKFLGPTVLVYISKEQAIAYSMHVVLKRIYFRARVWSIRDQIVFLIFSGGRAWRPGRPESHRGHKAQRGARLPAGEDPKGRHEAEDLSGVEGPACGEGGKGGDTFKSINFGLFMLFLAWLEYYFPKYSFYLRPKADRSTSDPRCCCCYC